MFENICEQIRDSIDRFLERLNEQLRQDQLILQEVFQQQDAFQLFNAHVSILEQLWGDQYCPPAAEFKKRFASEIKHFSELVRLFTSHGLSPFIGVRFFRAVQAALVSVVRDQVSDEATKLNLLTLFFQQSHIIDAEMIEVCAAETDDQTVPFLENANLRLLKEKATYKNIFDGTSNLVLITDGEGIIVELNPEAVVFFSPQRVIGRFCAAPLGLKEDSLQSMLASYPLNRVHEVSVSSVGGKRFFNLQIKPLVKELDMAHGIMLILSDITCMVDHRQILEQKVHERTIALSSSEKLLGAIFHAVGKGILLIDSEGEIVKANQQASEIYGRPLEILIGSPLCSLTDQTGCYELQQARERLIEGKQFRSEILSLYVDGNTFPSIVTMTRMNLDARPYWTLIVRDITEQKALEQRLREEKVHAEEMNVTLRNVLKSIEEDRKGFERNLTEYISSSVLPGIEKIRTEIHEDARQGYLTLLKDQLISLTSDFETGLDGDLLKLTKKELKICQFIKAGLSGKEICETMNLSFETIQTHRKNIRKKLGLRGRDQSLQQFLANKNCDF